MNTCLSQAESGEIQASEKTKAFWREKKAAVDGLLAVYANAEKDDGQLDEGPKTKREQFFAKAKEGWEVELRKVLVQLNGDIIGPYTLGE